MYALILLDNLQLSFVEPFSAPQKHFCLLLSNCERFVAHLSFCGHFAVRHRDALLVTAVGHPCHDALFLRSLNGILAYPPTVPAVSALWCGFVPHLWRSLYGILAFVRRRRLFLIKSSYKRTKIHFCAFGD